MIDSSSERSRNGESSSFKFIRDRIKSASDETQLLVTQLLVESGGSRRDIFMPLVRMMRSEPHIFPSVSKLLERDEDARSRVGSRIDHEVARRDSSAMRPDENRPTPLEWFFLTIPSLDIPKAESDWKRLCETLENIPKGELGTISLENIVKNVISDEPRTKAFVLEVHERTKKLQRQMQRPLTIYDVGCGPFPILGISAAIASPDSRVVCIEKNPMTAKIAQFIIDRLGLRNIEVIQEDALDMQTQRIESIDLLVTETFGAGLFDEPGIQICKKFASRLGSQGETIPTRVTLSATLFPQNKGITSKDGVRHERFTDGVVLGIEGSDFPILPSDFWHKAAPPEINMSDVPENLVIKGKIPLPTGVTLKEFNMNYDLCVCADVDLGSQQLKKYDSFLTFPIRLDTIIIPPEILAKNPDPQSLAVEFEFVPGSSSSSNVARARVVEKLE